MIDINTLRFATQQTWGKLHTEAVELRDRAKGLYPQAHNAETLLGKVNGLSHDVDTARTVTEYAKAIELIRGTLEEVREFNRELGYLGVK